MQTLKQISIQSWQPFEAQPTLPRLPIHPTFPVLLSLQLSSSFMTTQKHQAKGSQILILWRTRQRHQTTMVVFIYCPVLLPIIRYSRVVYLTREHVYMLQLYHPQINAN